MYERLSTLYIRRTAIGLRLPLFVPTRILITRFRRPVSTGIKNKTIRLCRRRRLDTQPTVVAARELRCVYETRFIYESVERRLRRRDTPGVRRRAICDKSPRDDGRARCNRKVNDVIYRCRVSMHYELYIGPSYTVFAAARIPVPRLDRAKRARDPFDWQNDRQQISHACSS